jgi:hypothetical protein
MDERLLSSAGLYYICHFPSDHHSRTMLSLVRTSFCYISTLTAKHKLISYLLVLCLATHHWTLNNTVLPFAHQVYQPPI